MSIKWCVIGAGGIADRRTIPALISDKNNKLVAVMDRVPEVAETVGKKYDVKYFSDEESMLKEVECDAVYIGTPVMCHYAQAMTVLKYKRNLFMEKPVAIDGEKAYEIVSAFKKQNLQIFIGYMMKYHNLHEKAKQLIGEGKIGQVVDMRLQFSCWYPEIANAWRQKKSLGGGGSVMDLGVHCIELAEFILDDEIDEVKSFCSTRTFTYEVEDSGVLIFKTKGGVLGHIDVNFNIPDNASESKLEIYGSKGYIICKGTLGQEEKGTLYHLYSPQGDYVAQQNRVMDKPALYQAENSNIYLKQIKDFCNLIENKKVDFSYADRAVQVQRVVDAIYGNYTKVK